jgi:hypothetical protein
MEKDNHFEPKSLSFNDALSLIMERAYLETENDDDALKKISRIKIATIKAFDIFNANYVDLNLGTALITNGNDYTDEPPLRILLDDAEHGEEKVLFIAECFVGSYGIEEFREEYARLFP